MENNDLYIPFIQHINESGTSKIEGTRENPNFLYTSNGGRAKSVIFHTEEDGKLILYVSQKQKSQLSRGIQNKTKKR